MTSHLRCITASCELVKGEMREIVAHDHVQGMRPLTVEADCTCRRLLLEVRQFISNGLLTAASQNEVSCNRAKNLEASRVHRSRERMSMPTQMAVPRPVLVNLYIFSVFKCNPGSWVQKTYNEMGVAKELGQLGRW